MNTLSVLMMYLIPLGIIAFFVRKISGRALPRSGKGIGRGVDFRNHPIKSCGKICAVSFLFLLYWSFLAAEDYVAGRAALLTPMAAFFFAFSFADIFLYGKKILSVLCFFGTYMTLYYLKFGATKQFGVLLFALVVFGGMYYVLYKK